MLSRPVDSSGDILPVISSADLLPGADGMAVALADHLRLFRGDWWEYADRGNEIFDLISVSRCTAQDSETLASALVSYILSFPGVQSVSEVSSSFSGRVWSFSGTAHLDSGETLPVTYSTQ